MFASNNGTYLNTKPSAYEENLDQIWINLNYCCYPTKSDLSYTVESIFGQVGYIPFHEDFWLRCSTKSNIL